MKKYTYLTLIAALVILAGCGSSSETTGTQFSPQEGKAYHYVTKTDMDMDVQGIAMEVNLENFYHYDVKEKHDTTYLLEMKFDSMKVSQVNPMSGSITYNSNKVTEGDPTEKQLHKSFTTMQDATIKIWVSENGKVVKKEGLDKLDESGSGMMQGGNLASTTDQNFISLPKGELKQGQSWNSTQMGPFDMETTSTYTITEVLENEVKLDVKLTGLENEEMEMNGMPVRINASTSDGNMTVDRNNGMIKEYELNQDTDMEMEAQGQVVEMKTKSKITIKRLD